MTTDLQKASLWKRIAAGILDLMLLCMAAVGFAVLLGQLMGYDEAHQELAQGYARYESAYGVDLGITEQEYAAMTPAEQEHFNAAYEALVSDDEVMDTYDLVVNLTLLNVTFSILLGYAVLEWLVPLLLKNGQTLGKKCFAIGLMRVDGVKMSGLQHFVRSILGKYTIETMIPVYLIMMMLMGTIGFVGPLVIGLLGLTQLIVMVVSRDHSLIHDLLAGTVAVDLSSQKIFETTQDLIDYQKNIAAERAARQPY